MGILDGLKSLFSSAGKATDSTAMWLYVRCKRCGAPLAVRVDLRNEPSPDYENGGYVLHKEMMDDKCFGLLRADLHMDAQHHITDRKIENGEFISQQEYARMTGQSATGT